MTQRAKLFVTGRSQAVRLPREFRFEGEDVFIRRDAETGDVVLSRRPDSWDGFLALCQATEVPDDFLGEADRAQGEGLRDPFEGVE